MVNGTKLPDGVKTDYKLLQNGQGQWAVNGGTTVYTLDAKQKKLIVTGSSLGGGQIIINDFDISKTGGYLGIKLERSAKIALIQGGGSNVFGTAGFDADSLVGQSSSITEGTGKSFTIDLNQSAKPGETLTLALSGAVSGSFKAVLGNSTVAANGAVIELKEGQTQLSFALISDSAIDADQAGSISASYSGLDASGAAQAAASSNSYGLSLKDAGQTENTFDGDFLVKTQKQTDLTITRLNQEGQEVEVVAADTLYYAQDSRGNLRQNIAATYLMAFALKAVA